MRFPPEWLELLERGDPALNDKVWRAFPGMHGQEFWLSRLRAHGLATPLEYCQEMRRWTVDVEAIRCPAFVSYEALAWRGHASILHGGSQRREQGWDLLGCRPP